VKFHELVSEYGYVSEGESFTIADSKEVWILEMIGKGREKGAVWVAMRVPDGHVSGHANQARIQHFPLDDPERCVYAPDVISFAEKVGLWDPSRPKEEFSFADVYDPITFFGARHSDARVWSFFSAVAADEEFEGKYADYVLGKNVTAAARMPLSIPARGKISVLELMGHMRNHYEDTALDPKHDVGAESSGSPYRTRPLVWKYGGDTYFNERTVGTQQAGWNFVAQLRGWLPGPVGGLLWFGVDDATFSVHAPFHGGTTRVPESLADGTGNALSFSSKSAFWAFNTVANFAYPRWHVAPEIIKRAAEAELSFSRQLQDEEEAALAMYASDPAAAIKYLTDKDCARADKVTEDEFALFGELMVTYRDGFYISSPGPNAPDHGGAQGGVVANVEEPGYPQKWYEKIVKDTGDRYKMKPIAAPALEQQKLKVLNKGIAEPQEPSAAQVFDIIV